MHVVGFGDSESGSGRKHALSPGATFGEATVEWSGGSKIGIWRDDAGLQLAFAANGQERRQTLALVHHRRHFGGYLAAMQCPRCCRSVRVVYCWRGRFVCRHCTSATYRSKTRGKAEAVQCSTRSYGRASGTEAYGLDYFPRRPKGMRRVTYRRLQARACDKLNRYHEHLQRPVSVTGAHCAGDPCRFIGNQLRRLGARKSVAYPSLHVLPRGP